MKAVITFAICKLYMMFQLIFRGFNHSILTFTTVTSPFDESIKETYAQ
jgi:hypothetical protein